MPRRWPLGLLGLSMTVYGGLVALMLFYAASGKQQDDALIDIGAPDLGGVATAEAVVTDAEETGAKIHGAPAERLSYTFRTERGVDFAGRSFGVAGAFRVGRFAKVDYLIDHPHINRLQQTRLCLIGDLVSPVLGLVVLPGLLLLLLWLQGALDLKRMMENGDAAVAHVDEVEHVGYVVPVMLRVRYRFRDTRAAWRQGVHWVRARSPLGVRLEGGSDRPVVLHDRVHPQHSRLVTSADFVAAPSAESPHSAEPV